MPIITIMNGGPGYFQVGDTTSEIKNSFTYEVSEKELDYLLWEASLKEVSEFVRDKIKEQKIKIEE